MRLFIRFTSLNGNNFLYFKIKVYINLNNTYHKMCFFYSLVSVLCSFDIFTVTSYSLVTGRDSILKGIFSYSRTKYFLQEITSFMSKITKDSSIYKI